MKVWFHTIMEQHVEEGEAYSYDDYTCSGLFATIEACVKDAEKERLQEFENHLNRYNNSLERYKKKLEAIEILKSHNIDPSELYWNVSDEPPEMGSPPKHYVYAIDVME